MTWKRRQFLVLGGLSGLGAAGLTKFWRDAAIAKPNGVESIPEAIATTPALSNTPLLRFVSVADTGTGARGQYDVANAITRYHQQNPFKTVILAGDNIYNNGEIEKIKAVFEKPYQPLLSQGVKFYAVLGNHDIRTDNGNPQVRYPGFNMQGRYYSFTQGPVQFFALDTNPNAQWDAQMKWLDAALARSQAPWKVVVGHHQIYSSGAYGTNPAFIKRFTPLFKKYRVQLYINGHEHSYERTKPIDGTTYLICGGGAGLRPVGRSEWTAQSASKLSFAALEVYRDRMTIQGIDRDSRVFDQGTIFV
jgi:3',5'-cyclic AMP phosphodiesterase CpdA